MDLWHSGRLDFSMDLHFHGVWAHSYFAVDYHSHNLNLIDDRLITTAIIALYTDMSPFGLYAPIRSWLGLMPRSLVSLSLSLSLSLGLPFPRCLWASLNAGWP